MIYNTFRYKNTSIQTAEFPIGRRELHAIICGDPGRCFSRQWEEVNEGVRHISEINPGLKPVFRRFFFSDILNQSRQIEGVSFDSPVSYVQQPPLNGSKLGLWVVFHQDGDFRETSEGVWEDSHGTIFFENVSTGGSNSYDATVSMLTKVAGELRRRNCSLLENCIRTWFVVHDVDTNYDGVVKGRNHVFEREGLTRDTHFIASTGIGGSPEDRHSKVSFNALCNLNLRPGQMGYLYGASHLNPTIEYGVAFERGTTVDFEDRRRVYISGTASIDNKGEILFPDDIHRQTERMIENIMVLLEEGGCGKGDIAHLLVYLRDLSDAGAVDAIFERELPGIPRILLLAPVCRPGWLVETECMAIKQLSSSLSSYL